MEEGLSKGRDGSVPGTHSDRAFKPKMFRTGAQNCPVENFLFYKNHRPRQMLELNAPFYLQAIRNPLREVWFKKPKTWSQLPGENTEASRTKSWSECAKLQCKQNFDKRFV